MKLNFYSLDIPQCPFSARACLWGDDDTILCYSIDGELIDYVKHPCCYNSLDGEESVAWYRYLKGSDFVLDVK